MTPRNTPNPLRKPSRKPPQTTRLFLYVHAGGRCEFDGCNKYLLEHYPTRTPGNFAEMAHIWAFSDAGPRGNAGIQDSDVHDLSNLMLLCPPCHKLVDDAPEQYTVEVLREFKRAHEDRVFGLTDTKPDRQTAGLVLIANIAGENVGITLPEMQSAVAPRYLGKRDIVEIDLTKGPDVATPEHWSYGQKAIEERVKRLYETPFDYGLAHHVSVFALAPIPLLIYLGSRLSNKIPVSLYQRHRDSEAWNWRGCDPGAEYEFRSHRKGTDARRVALIISLSGKIPAADLPPEFDASYTVYEIELSSPAPTPRFMECEQDLQRFRDTYLSAMRSIVAENTQLESLHLFPAVPAPAAVSIGRDLLPKRDPALVVHDFDKASGGFVRTLEVNRR